MPFPTDTNWPQGLLNIFDVCRRPNKRLTRMPVEACYYGPYDKLPNYAMIEGSFAFFLASQAVPVEYFPHNALAFIVFLVVFKMDQKPVLFAMIQNDGWATNNLTRLNYAMIEDTFAFFLAAQTPPEDDSLRYIKDLVVLFVIFDRQKKPVLFAVIKDDGWATTPIMR